MSDLERIERYATHAQQDAMAVRGAVRLLRVQPNFETRAQDALKKAEAELEESLQLVRQAQQEFSTKPVRV
jgi:formate-dependent nitrite reductase cytochrome c552 subunit